MNLHQSLCISILTVFFSVFFFFSLPQLHSGVKANEVNASIILQTCQKYQSDLKNHKNIILSERSQAKRPHMFSRISFSIPRQALVCPSWNHNLRQLGCCQQLAVVWKCPRGRLQLLHQLRSNQMNSHRMSENRSLPGNCKFIQILTML